jgi:hypothetical protein
LEVWLKWYSACLQAKSLEFNPQSHQKRKKKKEISRGASIAQH